MLLSTVVALVCESIAIAPAESPVFYARTIRQVCEAHGTDPAVFQYWWAEPKFNESDQEGHKRFSFGADAYASFWEERGRFSYSYHKSYAPREEERAAAWPEHRCRELAHALLTSLRPGTMWRLVAVDFNEFALKANYTFDAMIGDLPVRMLRLFPYVRVTIDATCGALYRMDIDGHVVTVAPGDLVENLTDTQYRGRAQAAYASFRPYEQCVVRPETAVVMDPSRLVYHPHSFTQRHLDMIAQKRGLRVHVVRFVRLPELRHSKASQLVMLDAKDGRPIAIVEDRLEFRSDPRGQGDSTGARPDIGALKFRPLCSDSGFASLQAVEAAISDAAEHAVIESADGSLWSVLFDREARLVQPKLDERVYRVSASFAHEVTASIGEAKKQPRMTAPDGRG